MQISADAIDRQEAEPHSSWKHRVWSDGWRRILKSDIRRVNEELLPEERARVVG
jgi:predicted SprT family Zn-dependent metalloprotease